MRISVLDHGYVEFIEAWGYGKAGEHDNDTASDHHECGIVEAARQSTQGSFRGWEQDERLLKYLFEHNHQTPFEFAGMVVEVQAPIFVFREWQRHRTQSYNEMSARYEPLPDLYYVPEIQRILPQFQDNNKQAQAMPGTVADTLIAEEFRKALIKQYSLNEQLYQKALKYGIPKELARCIMPVGHYSRMRASASLRNWLGFLALRLDPAAQWEIRQFALAVGELIQNNFPKTWQLFEEKLYTHTSFPPSTPHQPKA